MAFKVREAHWLILIEEMEKNSVIATGKFVGPKGRELYKNLWDNTSSKLNALGFGSRTTEKWQKTWTDYKYNLKKRAANIKKNIFKTGGGPSEGGTLSEVDLKLLDILGESFIGLDEPECGLPSTIQVDDPQPGLSGVQGTSSPDVISIQDQTSSYQWLPSSSSSIGNFETGEKRKRIGSTAPEKETMQYINEYRETIKELREIKIAVQRSLNEVSNVLLGLTEEVRGINNSLAEITHILSLQHQ